MKLYITQIVLSANISGKNKKAAFDEFMKQVKSGKIKPKATIVQIGKV